jgi:serine/threonine protein kinase
MPAGRRGATFSRAPTSLVGEPWSAGPAGAAAAQVTGSGMHNEAAQKLERIVGRYGLYGEIASGGMATVHFGRLLGAVGFTRTVAIKRLHPQFARDPEFVAMFLDEARLAARIQHPNVVSTLDVVALDGELFVVMEYVQGESLSRLHRIVRHRDDRVPPQVAVSIMCGVLHGLHAAHEATSDRGEPLEIVHRDVSPQNVLVGVDGVPKVLDFGVARASGRSHMTRDGQVKGKLAYMAPEQMRGEALDRRADVYGAAVVLWELLAGRGLFHGDEGVVYHLVMQGAKSPPSAFAPDISPALDAAVMRALGRDPRTRTPSALSLAVELEDAVGVLSARRLGEWVAGVAADDLARRAARVKEIESMPSQQLEAVTVAMPGSPHGREALVGLGDPSSAPRAAVVSSVSSVGASTPGAFPGGAPGDRHTPTNLDAQLSRVHPAPRSDKTIVVVAAIALVAGAGAAALTLGRCTEASSPTASAGTASASARGPSAEPTSAEPSQSSHAAQAGQPSPPSASVSAPGSPSASSLAEPASTGASQPSAPSASATGKLVRPAATAPGPARDCTPPYTVDASGIKRYKPHCL